MNVRAFKCAVCGEVVTDFDPVSDEWPGYVCSTECWEQARRLEDDREDATWN